MSNKMSKIILISVVLWLAAVSYSFEPRARDFSSDYQHHLYKSWIARESTSQDLPAKINSQYIKRSVIFEQTGQSDVVYIWDNWKIVSQREDLPAKLPYSNYETELILAGELLYRLNCRHKIFAEHYLQKMPISINYQGMHSDNALDSLFAHYPQIRLPKAELHPVIERDQLVQLILEFNNGDEIMIIFDDLSQYLVSRQQLREFEKRFLPENLPKDFPRHIPEAITYLPPVKKIDEPSAQEIEIDSLDLKLPVEPVQTDTTISDYEQRFLNWVEENLETTFGNEMLNNKISDMAAFLQEQFKFHSLLIKGDDYYLSHVPFSGGLKSDLYFEITENGGWMINSTSDVEIKGKKVIIAEFEDYDLNNLENYDIEAIAPFIPQLLMSHRVMSTDLAGFILEPDIAETTLVIHGNSRHIYEMESYRDMLMLLGFFWRDRVIYYNLGDFKLVNGYIEFKGYLAAESPQTGEYDLVEIRYRLDDDYTLVLAMAVVFPENSPIESQGR